MASSSVSQEDVENDYEKLEKRSRIRTARARQINPQGCRMEVERFQSNSLPPLGIEIEENLSELHLEPVSISPYSLQGEGGADTSPKGRDVVGGCNNRKDSVRGAERNHPSKSHHGIKGKQQRDRRKLREKRRSTGVVHLASTESTGGSTTGEEEMLEDMLCTETKRNTAQNESIGDTSLSVEVSGGNTSPTQDTPALPERKNSGRSVPHHHSHSPHNLGTTQYHNRARLRNKAPRSEDLEADDELGDKTDNDHDSLNLSESSSVTSVVPGPAMSASASVGLLVCEPNSSTSTPVMRPTTPTQAEGATDDAKDLLRQLQEKDRRIQFLEVKIQQLTQDAATILEEHQKLKEENSALLRALTNITK